MKAAWVIGAALLLAGCGLTSEGDAIRAAVADKGAAVYDQGLENAEWFVCKAASVGSVKRRYGTSSERAALYRDFCQTGEGEGHDIIGTE